jgi:NTE family protein
VWQPRTLLAQGLDETARLLRPRGHFKLGIRTHNTVQPHLDAAIRTFDTALVDQLVDRISNHVLEESEMTTAIVLSGGGSRGDFQLGALTALQEAGVRADILCSTSVGSLNALMLTQGESGLDELRKIWFGLRRNDHMWLFEDWWQELDPAMRKVIVGSLMGDATSGEPSSVALGTFAGGAVGSVLGPMGLLAGAFVGAALAGNTNNVVADAFTGAAVRKALTVISERARALLNLNPVRTLIGQHFSQARLDAFVASGKKLRLATVGLESGELCYVTETGDLLRRRSGERLAAGVPVLEGVMASAAIAAVFPPVNFAGDAWVDGGHRESVPLRAAIEAGADEIYVICSGPVDRWSAVNRTEEFGFTPPPTDFESRHLLDIANRALLSIHLDEMEADDIYPVLDERPDLKIKLIYPEYPTHDIVTIDADLIRVNYDYGYRSAWDVLRDAPLAQRDQSSRIALNMGRAARLSKKTWVGVGVPWATEIPQLLADAAAAAQARAAQGAAVAGPGKDVSFSRGSDMLPGERLLTGQSVVSPDGRFMLIHQTDGHLVVYRASGSNPYAEVIWASGAYGHEPGQCAMQSDGNLVVYDADMVPRWASGTDGQFGLQLRMQSDGRVVLTKDGHESWSTQPAGPDPVPEVRIVTIVNASPMVLTARFYREDDTVFAATLGDGTKAIEPGGSLAWPIPSDLNAVKVTFNGHQPRVMASGDRSTFDQDERVHVINHSPRQVDVRIFNATDLLRVVALPGGEFSLPAGGENIWLMPEDIDRVVVVLNGRWVYEAVRGTVVTHERDDRILVRNQSGLPVAARFYRVDDTWRWATLPGGDLNVNAQSEAFFGVPPQFNTVQAVVAGQRFNVDTGETLLVGPSGRISRS